MKEILLNKPGKKIILLGNEAIVRGALESGVQFVSTYPGTPASEIGDTFYKVKSQKSKVKSDFHFEYSTNEKVALEAAIGASFSGLKSLVAMKHFGLNVASDALIPFCHTGSKGPTIIVVADDVGCWSSAQSEQNCRAYSYLAHIPTLEPSDPKECKDFVRLGFQISEKFNIPVMIRTTTRVAHQRAPVKLGKLPTRTGLVGKFVKDTKKFVTMPPRVLEMKRELLEKIEKIRDFSEKSPINRICRGRTSTNTFGIVTSGISFLYVMEALKELKLNLPVLKLGFFYPLPERKIKNFIKKLKKVLIVEELEPYLKKEVERLAKEVNPKIRIFGKDLLPEVGEFKPEQVISALAKVTGKTWQLPETFTIKDIKHLPRFCVATDGTGCPYWRLFAAIKQAAPKTQNVVFGGDIGCYMLGAIPPHNLYDYLSCMGSSVGIAHGIKKSTGQKVIALIGDSTFFHAGIPALINTTFNKSNPLIIVLDNRVTAMTGLQPHPGAPKEDKGIKIEEVVRACGVKNLKVIDPVENFKKMVKTIKDFLKKKEVSVIIARHSCWLLQRKRKK